MEDLFSNITSPNSTNNDAGMLSDTFVFYVSLVIIIIGLPLTILAIYTLYSQVQNDDVAPIFVINLLISSLIQICSTIIYVAQPRSRLFMIVNNFVYIFGVIDSVCFMVCVAMERYLIVVWPLWYLVKRSIKASVVVCVVVWVLPSVLLILSKFTNQFVVLPIFLLLPFPLLIFFLAGTLKALSAAISVSSQEKRSIVGVLVLVLLNYTLLFLPEIIELLAAADRMDHALSIVSSTLILFSPLADLVLYVFMRKGATNNLLACLCHCKMDTQQKK